MGLPPAARSFASSGSTSANQAAPKATALPGRTASGTPAKIASSGTLHLTVARAALHDDVAALGGLASRLGGYVSSTNVTEHKKASGGSLEIAVPASSFTAAIAGAERLGQTRSLVTRSSDVTKAYSDTTAQITALEDVRTQLESLLKRSGKISDLLAVEQEIQSTQSQIDVLESERSSLDREVTYATLVVDLAVPVPAVHRPARPGALDKAWSKAVSGFAGGLKWLLGISGAVLFAVLLVAAVGLLTFLFIRRALPRLRRHFL